MSLPPPWQIVIRITEYGPVKAARIYKLVGHGEDAEHGVSFWYSPSTESLERCDQSKFNEWRYS